MYRKRISGFTLVELTISMTFIAILMLVIALFLMQLTSIYNKGLTLRSVNEAGQRISSELQRTINQTDSDAIKYIFFPTGEGGRLCIGTTAYAWNYAQTINTNPPTALNKNPVTHTADVRFVKFSGSAIAICEQNGAGSYNPIPNTAVEILSQGNGGLALHSLAYLGATDVYQDPLQKMHQIDFILGTSDLGVITGNNCQASGAREDEYCAINDFSVIARSGNKEAS